MSEWSLPVLLATLHGDIQQKLEASRKAFGHSVMKGDASEAVWNEMLNTYLPERYHAEKAVVVDSEGKFSDAIDVVVFDRQYSPFVLNYQGQKVIPAESVYAVFEAKQTVNLELVRYAQEKATSVRVLTRTSLPIPHAGGLFGAKEPPHIIAGLLSFESDWTPALGASLAAALEGGNQMGKLDIGCVAAHGIFALEESGKYAVTPEGKPATAFLLELIARLQDSATVPMMDVRAYAKWLLEE